MDQYILRTKLIHFTVRSQERVVRCIGRDTSDRKFCSLHCLSKKLTKSDCQLILLKMDVRLANRISGNIRADLYLPEYLICLILNKIYILLIIKNKKLLNLITYQPSVSWTSPLSLCCSYLVVLSHSLSCSVGFAATGNGPGEILTSRRQSMTSMIRMSTERPSTWMMFSQPLSSKW